MTRLILSILLVATFSTSAFAGDPKQAVVHNKQAKAYFDAKQFDDAIREFRTSYDLDPKPLTLYKIASAYYAKGDYKGAIEYYQKYLAADPDGPFAAQAIEFSTIANKAVADEAARQQAALEAARVEAERKAAEAEADRKRLAATARIKQAEAYAKAGAWASAGQEYTAAAEVGDDPAHLLSAAEAFRKAPDDMKARAAYLAYLDKVPTGPRSDEVRGNVADLSRVIEKAASDERERQRKLQEAMSRPVVIDAPKQLPHEKSKRGWIAVGGTLLLTGLAADLRAPNGDNGKLDGTDFIPPVLYLLGTAAVLRGVF